MLLNSLAGVDVRKRSLFLCNSMVYLYGDPEIESLLLQHNSRPWKRQGPDPDARRFRDFFGSDGEVAFILVGREESGLWSSG